MHAGITSNTADPGTTRSEHLATPAAVPMSVAMPVSTSVQPFAPTFFSGGLKDALRSALSVALRAEHRMNKMAAANAHYAVLSASGEFRSTAMRAFRQDVKDPVKDQGEAGHKP